jgi:hypothetical protein
MGRVMQLAAAVVVAMTAIAHAGGAIQHVMVDTDPKGAVVYVDDVDKGAACQPTPCGFDLVVGNHTLIVQKAAFAPQIEQIDIPRHPKKPLTYFYKLDASNATIVVENAAVKGASVAVEGVQKAKVDSSGSAHIDVEPGGHQITVTLNGKEIFDDFVNIDQGEEYVVKLSATAGATPVKAPPKETATTETESTESTESSETSTSASVTTASAASPEPTHYISGDVVVDVGFRRFSYENATMGPLSPETEDGQVIGGPAVEIWPMEIFGAQHLRGLSLFGRFEFPINSQNVLDSSMNAVASTYWLTIEGSLRYRWTIADTASVEVSGGYVRDELRFNGDAGDVVKLPDADYQSLRLGVKGSLLFGAIEPYVSAENRVVLDGGVLQTRFSTASAGGIKGAIGVAAHGGNFTARLEGSDLHYSWAFTSSSTAAPFQADGATDKVLCIQFLLGYAY